MKPSCMDSLLLDPLASFTVVRPFMLVIKVVIFKSAVVRLPEPPVYPKAWRTWAGAFAAELTSV